MSDEAVLQEQFEAERKVREQLPEAILMAIGGAAGLKLVSSLQAKIQAEQKSPSAFQAIKTG